jgi:hypothetical protein
MNGDAVSAGGFAQSRGFHQLRLTARPPSVSGFAQGGHVIDVNTEFEHGL